VKETSNNQHQTPNIDVRPHSRAESILFLCRPVSLISMLGSLFGLALMFYLIWQIRNDDISGIFYLTIFLVAVAILLVSFVLSGALKLLRGETTIKRCLIYIGCGFCIVPIGLMPIFLIQMPIPFLFLVPLCLLGFLYGVGGYIGFCIQRRRNHVA
jgi:cation transport ATPase